MKSPISNLAQKLVIAKVFSDLEVVRDDFTQQSIVPQKDLVMFFYKLEGVLDELRRINRSLNS